MRVRRLMGLMLLAALAAAPAAQAHPPRAHQPQLQVVASDLDSPRHLAFDWRGNLYVAEAGRGGSGPCFIGGEQVEACVGDSGAVTRIDRRGHQARVAEHLASYANTPANDNAIGPHGITVVGNQVFVTNGGPTEPKTPSGTTISRDELAAQNDAANLFGWLLRLRRPGQEPQKIADLWAFERDVNPDKAGGGNPAVDSNPVDVLFDGRRFVVADAG